MSKSFEQFEASPQSPQEEIVEIEGKRFRKKYIGDLKGLDGESLTEKRYYSHTGPGWDMKFHYFKDRNVSNVEDLSDEPYIYELIMDDPVNQEKIEKDREVREKQNRYMARQRELLEGLESEIPDYQERWERVRGLLEEEGFEWVD